MKHISELTDFYYKTLYPTLEKLEKKRKKIRKKILTIGFFYISLTFILVKYYLLPYMNQGGVAFFGIASLAIGAFLYKNFTKEYTSEFKEKIIAPLIQEIDANLHYFAPLHIPLKKFQSSKLFKTPDKFTGNDYVQGKIDSINIEFSDVHAQKKSKDSKGRTTWSTIFQGLFIVSEFNKNFHGYTLIYPDFAQSIFGDLIGGWLQANKFGESELVKMDNVAFEKEFVVYSSDQIEARYILSPTLMQKLLEYRKKSKHPLYISFYKSNIHIAIDYDKDLFEPYIFQSLLDYKVAKEYMQTLHLAISIVEELQLNQKLWSKF